VLMRSPTRRITMCGGLDSSRLEPVRQTFEGS
jgi:hypothetical protein